MRTVRLLGAVAFACASVPLVSPGTAHADGVALVPSNGAYFYSLGIDKPEAAPQAPPNVTATVADGVSAEHLAVAANGGQEDKVSFLYFDLFTLPAGITVTKAVVTMKTVDAPPEDISFQATPESVVACKAGDGGFSGDDGVALKLAPERLCSAFSAKGSAGAPGTYQWDVTSLAQTWVSGSNDGLAFTRADSSPNSNFQVVFDKASTATMQLEYSLPTPEVPIDVPPVSTPPAPEVPAVGGYVPPTSTDGFAPAPEVPIVPNPTVNVAPVPAGGQTAAVATRPVALSTSLRPTGELWLAGLALAGALVLLSLVLGDPQVAAATRSTSRLSLALAGNKRLAPVGVLRPRHL